MQVVEIFENDFLQVMLQDTDMDCAGVTYKLTSYQTILADVKSDVHESERKQHESLSDA